MIRFPNAKINIGLFVTGKRPDAYHNLESLFYPLYGVRDALEIVPCAEGEETALLVGGKAIEGELEDNLVWRAYRLLASAFPDKVAAIRIHLLKAIPMGAGMGGGSADASFMLCMLNDYFDLGLSAADLEAYALQLGSDCPFFIQNSPQFAVGRGELLRPVALDLGQYQFLVVCPRVHVSTAQAFRNITIAPPAFDLSNLADMPIAEWKDKVYNAFELTVLAAYPELSGIKEALYAHGALYASMSGSGSSFYGIFPKQMVLPDSLPELAYLQHELLSVAS